MRGPSPFPCALVPSVVVEVALAWCCLLLAVALLSPHSPPPPLPRLWAKPRRKRKGAGGCWGGKGSAEKQEASASQLPRLKLLPFPRPPPPAALSLSLCVCLCVCVCLFTAPDIRGRGCWAGRRDRTASYSPLGSGRVWLLYPKPSPAPPPLWLLLLLASAAKSWAIAPRRERSDRSVGAGKEGRTRTGGQQGKRQSETFPNRDGDPSHPCLGFPLLCVCVCARFKE